MRNALSFTLLFAAILTLAGFRPSEEVRSSPPEKKETKILDAYECNGVSAEGKKYTLPLAVKREGENYFLAWGKNVQLGVGIRTGDTLSIFFSNLEGKTAEGKYVYVPGGVAAYTVGPGMLTGKWAVGDGKVYIETCTPPKSLTV